MAALPGYLALVNLAAPGPKPGSQSCSQAGDCDTVFSYAMFQDLERVQTPFTAIAAHVSFGANLAARGFIERARRVEIGNLHRHVRHARDRHAAPVLCFPCAVIGRRAYRPAPFLRRSRSSRSRSSLFFAGGEEAGLAVAFGLFAVVGCAERLRFPNEVSPPLAQGSLWSHWRL